MLDLALLNAEIAKLENGKTSYDTVEKLLPLYTARDNHPEYNPQTMDILPDHACGYAGTLSTVYAAKTSDFIAAVNGKQAEKVLAVIDELMDTLRAVNPKAYNSVMRKIREL